MSEKIRFDKTALRHFFRVAAVSAALAAAPIAGATDFDDPPGDDPRFDEGVLELVPGADIAEVIARYGFMLLESIDSRNTHLVSFMPSLTEDEFELLFLNDADIDHSELNFDTGDAGPNSGSLFFNVAPSRFTQQPVWGAMGLASAHTEATGSGVVIAVIDTGIDTSNPMFLGKIHPASVSLIDAPGGLNDVGDGINSDGDAFTDEMVGHGTWAAGIASMVAPDARLMIIRTLNDEGYADAFTLARAVYHAIDNGADVINLSLGSSAQVDLVEDAVDDASDLGIIVVAAAGNQNSVDPEWPAGNNKSAGIAAVALDGTLAPFSNWSDGSGGDDLLLGAPGIDITGPVPGGFGESSGTSASVPLVAGTAALLIEKGTVRRWDDFEEMAKQTAVDVSSQNPGYDDDVVGEGMLDIAAALAWEGPCFADLDDDGPSDGVLDLADVQAFITGFTTRDEDVDYADPRGVWDLADVQFFLQAFADGCP